MCQGVPAEAGAGGHGLLGAEREEKASQGGEAQSAGGHGHRDEKDLEAGGLDVPPHVALTSHVHADQEEDETEEGEE